MNDTTAAAKCECGNNATTYDGANDPACEWCADHYGHTAPVSIATGHTLIGGEYVARCSLCDYVCAYWECGCELAHECGEMVSIIDGDYQHPAGYYPSSDGEPLGIAVCNECDRDVCGENTAEPIGYWHETDTPVHCDMCDALLVTTLTPDGIEWVRDAIASPFGRNDVKRAWVVAFASELAAETE